jgi:NitT/TauT family transport system substrate-binding protein
MTRGSEAITIATLVRAACAAMLLALAAGPAAAQEKIAVKFDFLPYGSHAPFYLAKEKGWYKDAGVEPTFDDGQGSQAAIQLITGGRIDVAYVAMASVIIARDKGAPVKAIGGVLRKNDFGVLVDAASDIHKPKDLEGKVLYFSPPSSETLYMDLFFRLNGVDKSKVKLTSIDLSTKVSTYMSGKGDAMFVPIPIYTIEAAPRKSRGLLFADYGIPMPGFGIISSDSIIKAKPKALGGFTAAVQRAWTEVARDPKMLEEAIDALFANRPQAKLNRTIVTQQLKSVLPFLVTDATKDRPMLWQSPTEWEGTIKINEAAGAIKKGSNAAEYYTNEFVPDRQR